MSKLRRPTGGRARSTFNIATGPAGTKGAAASMAGQANGSNNKNAHAFAAAGSGGGGGGGSGGKRPEQGGSPPSAVVTALSAAWFRQEENFNVGAGSTVATTWNKRVLNTEAYNNIEGCSLDTVNDKFTLPAGVFHIHAWAPSYIVARHRLKLYNEDGAVDVFHGVNGWDFTTHDGRMADLQYVLTVSTPTAFSLYHYTQETVASSGLGLATNSAIDSRKTIGTEIIIRQIS